MYFWEGSLVIFCIRWQLNGRTQRQRMVEQYPFGVAFTAFGCLVWIDTSARLPEYRLIPRPSSTSDVSSRLVGLFVFSEFTLLQVVHKGTWWEGQRQSKCLMQSILNLKVTRGFCCFHGLLDMPFWDDGSSGLAKSKCYTGCLLGMQFFHVCILHLLMFTVISSIAYPCFCRQWCEVQSWKVGCDVFLKKSISVNLVEGEAGFYIYHLKHLL